MLKALSYGVLLGTGGLLAITWVGYPAAVIGAARLARRRPTLAVTEEGEGEDWPHISFIIAAYNEAAVIEQKIEATLALDYPADRFEVIVASDGSDDGTDEIVARYADRGVRLVNPGRVGKTRCAIAAAEVARGALLVFSDATSEWSSQGLRALVGVFASQQVGLASGRVMYSYGSSTAAGGFRFYQKLVVALRRGERVLGTQASVSGACHAIRKELFSAVDGTQSYDLVHPLHVAIAGRDAVYVNEAVVQEEARDSVRDEFRARVRAAVVAYSFLPYLLKRAPEVRKRAYLPQMALHKVSRWVLPVGLAASLPAAGYLTARGSLLGGAALAAQLAGYGAVGAGLAAARAGLRLPLVGAPTLFLSTNAAFLVGLRRFLRGERMATWDTGRPEAAGG